MTTQIASWKRRRAVAANKLAPGAGVDAQSIRESMAALRSRGLQWYATGFDDWDPDHIVNTLQRHGVATSVQWFKENANKYPGPTEIAEIWTHQLKIPRQDAEAVSLLPHLAARALWAKLLPDLPSIETTVDELERRILSTHQYKQKVSEDEILETLEFIAKKTEGSIGVRRAFDEELPISIGTWFLHTVTEVGTITNPDAWQKRVDALAATLGASSYHHITFGNAMARAGHTEYAWATIERALADGDDTSTLYNLCAECARIAGFYQRAVELAKEALLRCNYEPQDEQRSKLILKAALEDLGQSAQLEQHLQEVNLAKRKQTLALRKDRKRKEKRAERR